MVRVEKELLVQVEQIAATERRSVTAQVAVILQDWLPPKTGPGAS